MRREDAKTQVSQDLPRFLFLLRLFASLRRISAFTPPLHSISFHTCPTQNLRSLHSFWKTSTPIGGRPTIFLSARFISTPIRCCASRSRFRTSSRDCWGTGGRRRG